LEFKVQGLPSIPDSVSEVSAFLAAIQSSRASSVMSSKREREGERERGREREGEREREREREGERGRERLSGSM
jgi:hypothetical protein